VVVGERIGQADLSQVPGRRRRFGSFTRRQVFAMTAVAALGEGLADCSGDPGHSAASRPMPPRDPGDKPAWMLTRYALGQVVKDPVVKARLGGSRTFQLVQPGQEPLAWDGSITVVTFSAVRELTETIIGKRLPADTGAVLYDCEAWPFTPTAEQHDPVGATSKAKAVAHSHGLALIVAPALNLATVRHHDAPGPNDIKLILGPA
jgi:hypothetical protein